MGAIEESFDAEGVVFDILDRLAAVRQRRREYHA